MPCQQNCCHMCKILNFFNVKLISFVTIFGIWAYHDDIIEWKHFPHYWPFVRGTHRSPVDSPHKGQWHGALMFSLIWAWTNSWVNNWWFEMPSSSLWRHRYINYLWNGSQCQLIQPTPSQISVSTWYHNSVYFFDKDVIKLIKVLRYMHYDYEDTNLLSITVVNSLWPNDDIILDQYWLR